MITGLTFTVKDYFSTSSSSIEVRQSISKDKTDAQIEVRNVTYIEGGITDSVIWENNSDFEEGIFENTTAVNDRIYLSADNTTGVWYSDVKELEGPLNFTLLSADGMDAVPDAIEIRIRTAEDRESLTGQFLGPGGTDDTTDFYDLSMDQAINDVHDGDQVLQAQVLIEDEFTNDNSYLDYLEIGFEYMAILDVFIRNTGTMEQDQDRLDFFVIDERLSRDSIIEMNVVEEEGFPNQKLWDSEMDLRVKLATGLLDTGALFTVTNEFGSRDSERIMMG
ncbi:MAG: hypothetical protein ACLFTR_03155 [Candidatus Woesearchaeota archaeon]